MKITHILSFLLVATLFFSCKKDPVAPAISITPNNFLVNMETGDLIEFSIKGLAGDADLRSLEITSKPEGGVTTTILEEDLFGKSSSTLFVFDIAEHLTDNQVLVFTVIDEDGRRGQLAKRILYTETDPLLIETAGHHLYSNFATGNPNGFHIAELDPLFLASLEDSLSVDLVQLDADDDDMMTGIISSYSGIKFTRNNAFNYAEASAQMAAATYESSVPLQTISDLQVDDILITRFDTINMLHAAIKVVEIQDLDGTETDRITFNVKK